MTYGLILIKGSSEKRRDTRLLLQELSKANDFERSTGVKIEKVLISFGWPDFILLVKAENVELIKHAIVTIRGLATKKGDTIETSTVICVTQQELDKKRKDWANRYGTQPVSPKT